jgi:hypothetical protein
MQILSNRGNYGGFKVISGDLKSQGLLFFSDYSL